MNKIEEFVSYLKANKLRLATAESCTAGMIVSLLANIEGSGACMDCGYVVYSPEAKIRLLGVNPETIDQYNLTSEAVAREMAAGALRNSDATIAIANTGIAGPEPQDGIVPGTVCFAWVFLHEGESRMFSRCVRFSGDRNEVREAAARHALAQACVFHQRVLRGDYE